MDDFFENRIFKYESQGSDRLIKIKRYPRVDLTPNPYLGKYEYVYTKYNSVNGKRGEMIESLSFESDTELSIDAVIDTFIKMKTLIKT